MTSATRVLTGSFGVLMGLAGLEHGIGEILQGSVAPKAVMFASWPDSEFFRIVGGEPAMTLVPNLLASGILTILFSLVFIVWATVFAGRRHGGLVLILLSIAVLLVGGGFAPPLMGIILGVVATRINAPLTWWRAHLAAGLRRYLGEAWPGFLSVCLIAWLMLFPGTSVLGYFFGVNDPNFVLALILVAFGTLLLTTVAGFAYDIQKQADAHQKPSIAG